MTEKIFPAKLETMDDAMEYVTESLKNAGLERKAITQVKVAFEELYVNVCNYAYSGEEGDICIRFEDVEDHITITISDNGKPFNPLAKEDPDIMLSVEKREIGGLGIYMAKKYTDKFTYNYIDKKNIITIEKNK